MIFKKIKYILYLLATLALFLFMRCTPQKRLDRLVKNNPELVKTDTTTERKTHITPGFTLDTTTAASHDVADLYKVIDAYKGMIDSLTRSQLKTEIGNYIINRNCLDQPLTINFPGGGFFRIYQLSGKFFYHVEQPPVKFNFVTKQVTMTIHPVIKYNWQMFVGGFFVGWLVLCLMIFLFGRQIIQNQKLNNN